MVELSVNVEDRDPHHKDGYKDVEQHAEFDQHWRVLHEAHPKGVDTILKHEIAQHLGEGFSAADNDEETNKAGEEGDRNNERK